MIGRWLCVVLLAASVQPAFAATTGSPVGPAESGITAVASLRQQLMTRDAVLRGDIDGRNLQLNLKPKKNEDGLEGKYFYFGDSIQVLVAGEVDGDDIVMEESINGKDVSGQWIGHREGRTITGTWSNADGSVSKPFSLQLPD